MVIFATLDTNIKNIVQDPVDSIHRIKYPKCPSDPVLIKDCGGRHTLNLSTGALWLGDIQCPEQPIVFAMARYGIFHGARYDPRITPSAAEFDSFPTIFELERLAREPIDIKGITRLSSDGVNDFSPEHSYFREQRAALDEFAAAYARLVGLSPLGKPVLEGFYETMRELNTQFLNDAENPERPEAGRKALRRHVFQEGDFADAFGRTLFDQLRTAFGEPRFR